VTREQIASMIESIGLPYAYDHFEETEAPGNPPFICFFYPSHDDFIADDTNYQSIIRLVIELYTDNIDFTLESRVESALTGAGLPYTSEREWIESERMYQTTYNTEVTLQPSPEPGPGDSGTNN